MSRTPVRWPTRQSVLRIVVVGMIVAHAVPNAAVAQTTAEPQRRPRVGVVLSGGSAKGFAHIGVLRVLERAGIPVDVVAGASMGSLVGGLYAIGYGPDALERIALSSDWPSLFSDSGPNAWVSTDGRVAGSSALATFSIEAGRIGLPGALVPGMNIWRLLARLTWPAQPTTDFRRLPIPFAATATDLETGNLVVLDHGSLPTALRASMSLPAVFAPVRIGSQYLVDGGIVRNLPSGEARALGADVIICSDVSAPLGRASQLRSFVDVLLQTVSFQGTRSTDEQRRLCDVLITPDITGLEGTSFAEAAQWIQRGEAAAAASLEQARAALPELPRSGLPPPSGREPVHNDSIAIEKVTFEGLPAATEHFMRAVITVQDGSIVTAEQLDAAISHAYGTGLFDAVTYRFDTHESVTDLVFVFEPRRHDTLALGLRYDTEYLASVLLSATIRSGLPAGSAARIRARLGEELLVDAEYRARAGVVGPTIAGVAGGYSRLPLAVFRGDMQVAEARAKTVGASGFVGRTLGNATVAEVRLALERTEGTSAIAPVGRSQSTTYLSISGIVQSQDVDQPAFPMRGRFVYLRSDWAPDTSGEAGGFWQAIVDVEGARPVTRDLSLLARFMTGASGGSGLPFQYQFFLGGINVSAIDAERHVPMPGLDLQQRTGRAVQYAHVGARYRFGDRLFASLLAHAGATSPRWHFNLGDYDSGVSLSGGMRTFAGPVELTLGYGRSSRRLRLDLSLGHSF